jgi:hypothetical protein
MFKQQKAITRNIPLIVGIAIPLLMIVFVALSIYLPTLFVKPKFDFLYAVGGFYGTQYSVKNGQLIETYSEYPKYYTPQTETKLFFYDIKKNESQEISFEQAKKFQLDSNIESPDGFEVVYGRRGEGIFPFFFFSERDYQTVYIQGHNLSKKLNIRLSGAYYQRFQFLGWVIK